MSDERETVWRWRWRCGVCPAFVIQGQGDREAMAAADDAIRDHRAVDDYRLRQTG